MNEQMNEAKGGFKMLYGAYWIYWVGQGCSDKGTESYSRFMMKKRSAGHSVSREGAFFGGA